MPNMITELEEAFYQLFRLLPADELMENHELICWIKRIFETADT